MAGMDAHESRIEESPVDGAQAGSYLFGDIYLDWMPFVA
jgi:hypothetical protein